jgi:hypothetical protein
VFAWEKPFEVNSHRYASIDIHRAFQSIIVSGFPVVLSPIEEKTVRLLYRGTRDGFTASNHDSLVPDHSNLLALVETTGGWRFGCYTHCTWLALSAQ